MRPSSRAVVRRAQRRARAEAAGRHAALSPASKPQDVASRSRPRRTAPAPPPHHGCAEPAEPARATRSGSDPSSPRGTLMRSNVSRETIWCLRTDVSRETFGSFAVSSGSPRAARSRCPLFRGMRGRDSRAEREARGTGRQSAGRAGLAGGARGARGGQAKREARGTGRRSAGRAGREGKPSRPTRMGSFQHRPDDGLASGMAEIARYARLFGSVVKGVGRKPRSEETAMAANRA